MSIKYTVDDILKNENLDVSDNFKYKGRPNIKVQHLYKLWNRGLYLIGLFGRLQLTEADEHFSIAISTIMSMTQNAYQIFKSSRVEAKRAILNILLSNLKIKDKQISYNLRKPFDLIDSLNEKTPPKIEGVAIGDPNGIRTHITTVKG